MFLVHVIKSLYLPHLLSFCDHLFWWLLHTLEYFRLETLWSHLSHRDENHKDIFGLPSLSLAIWALVQGRPDYSTWWWVALVGPHLGCPCLYSWRELLSVAAVPAHLPIAAPTGISLKRQSRPSSAVTHEVSHVWMSSLFLLSLWAACKCKCQEPVLAQNSPAGQYRPSPRGALLARHPEGDTLYLLWDTTPGFTELNLRGQTCKGTYLVRCCPVFSKMLNLKTILPWKAENMKAAFYYLVELDLLALETSLSAAYTQDHTLKHEQTGFCSGTKQI